ncbi:intraflagellar transport protein 56-like isoform X1 [Daphnia pulicaria]|uniref:intraflagellar transport protein 56-like isoform X1 n=2 Tax=Daphnia pulicaria TaxID=35523 RepID=UPI001EEC505B|nr:intraflagellar transport protein 56-like isoform X1 [Daphnia pulicaria]
MLLSRTKPVINSNSQAMVNLNEITKIQKMASAPQEVPSVIKFIENRDFQGAITLLEYEKLNGSTDPNTDLWLVYCEFHRGNYKQALLQYESTNNSLYAACCYFYLGMYQESRELVLKAPKCPLQVRLSFHLAHKSDDEVSVLEFHRQLRDVAEDQLSLAAVHYLRAHYQEAIDIYKRLVLQNKELMALHVYIALCYYKLDFYDVSQEVLSVYLQKIPDSLIALNLKACNIYRLYNGRSAEIEIRSLLESQVNCPFGKDLLNHNLVIFRNGDGALQVLPPLVGVIPEAKLNLIIYYLRQDETKEAFDLMQDVNPSLPAEYILKGIVYALIGQETNNKEYLDTAIQYLHLVGGSSSECDTIPGRQCVASAFFLQRQYEDVLLYFNSIKSYLSNDDTFKFNLAQVQTILGHYKEAEEELVTIQSAKYRSEYNYIECLTRCLVMNRKAVQAWEIYSRMETSAESLGILHLLANDCYRTGQFYIASKAFDVLDKYDPNPEHAAAKRGACVGLLQMVLAGREHREALSEVVNLMRGSPDPQMDHILRVINTWAKENRMKM